MGRGPRPIRTAAVLSTFLLVALAGCLESDSGAATPRGADPTPQPLPSMHPFEGDDCSATAVGVPTDFANTDPWLPPGFQAADMSRLVFAPANLGQAVVVGVAVTCGDSTYGPGTSLFLTTILVEDPPVDGVVGGAYQALYVTHAFTDSEDLARSWSLSSFPVMEGLDPAINIELESPVALLPDRNDRPTLSATRMTTPRGDSSWENYAGSTYLLAGETLRFWHQDQGGITYLELVPDAHAVGGLGDCLFADGTAMAQVSATAGCIALQSLQANEAFGITVTEVALGGTFHHLPGVTA